MKSIREMTAELSAARQLRDLDNKT